MNSDKQTALDVVPRDTDGAPTPEDLEKGDKDMAPLTRVATADYPKSFQLALIVVALILSIFLVSLDMTIVATAIPKITDEFHSLDQVGWYGSAFFLTVAAFQSTWGKGYKYFPLKTAFLISIGIFELGSLICAVAQNSTTLIIGRAIAGLGGAGIGAGAYTIIAFAVPPNRRAAFTGILGATYGVASVIGPLLGGVFTTQSTWRWCFYINLPIGGASAAVILIFFTTPAASRPVKATWKEKFLQMDPMGSALLIAAVVCFLLALQWGGVTKAWSDSKVVGTLVGFVLLVICFIVNEYLVGDRALLQGSLLRRRDVMVPCAYVFFFGGAFFVLLYFLPIYFQSVDGVSASDSGIRNLPLVLTVSICTVISGGLISAFGVYVPWLYAGSIITTVGMGFVYTLDIGSPSSKWIGYQALAGIGIGLGFQVPIIANQAFVDMSEISSITAVTLFFQTIGGAFFVSAAETAFANRLLADIPTTAPSVQPGLVIATGATQLRSVFAPDQIPGILIAYMSGLKVAYALAIALAGITLPIALLAVWKDAKPRVAGPGIEEEVAAATEKDSS